MLAVDETRLWASLMDLGRLGALPHGGVCRLAATALDHQARRLFIDWCQQAGCTIAVDAVGNIFARRRGKLAHLDAVATGSHLDTQPHGGKFDGAYGVLAGLEVIRTLNDRSIVTDRAIDLVVWTNEEGVRFSPALAGSSVFTGSLDAAQLLDTVTGDGTLVRSELEAGGFLGTERPGARVFDCFLEAHIEQGPLLELAGASIGVVMGVQGLRAFAVEVIGEDAHAGTTPMHIRRDALAGAAEMIAAIESSAAMQSKLLLTVGRLIVDPNSPNTIPGRVEFTIDLRHPVRSLLDEQENAIRTCLQTIAHDRRLTVSIRRTHDLAAVSFDDSIIRTIHDAATQNGYSSMEILSGAGHDAMNLAKVVPSGMIFIPCKGGVSHNEAEWASSTDCAMGANVLLHTILERACSRGAL
jgi:N-carbamoyl-L-amino-acid hydrolase